MTDATTATAPQRAARWVMVLGVVMIVAGVLAVFAPGPAALATSFFFAAMFIVGGAAEIAHAMATRTQDGFGWKLAVGDRDGPPRRAVRRVPGGGDRNAGRSSSAPCCSRTASPA